MRSRRTIELEHVYGGRAHRVAIHGRRADDDDPDHNQCHPLRDEGEVAMLHKRKKLGYGQNVRLRRSGREGSHLSMIREIYRFLLQ